MGRVYQRKLVLGMIQGAFPGLPSTLEGEDPPSVSLYPLFIVVSFLLNRVLRVDTCPISISFQFLGVVVRSKKYSFVRHKALNAIVAAFPLDVSIFFVIFSALVLFLTCETIWSVATGGLLPLLP